MRRLPVITAATAGVLLSLTGCWALLAPRSFYNTLATFPPYNRHLLHDIGAFLVGLGIALVVALGRRRALTVALVGNAVAGVLHAVSHIVDRHLGGRTADPYLFSLVAVVLTAAAAQSIREDSTP